MKTTWNRKMVGRWLLVNYLPWGMVIDGLIAAVVWYYVVQWSTRLLS